MIHGTFIIMLAKIYSSSCIFFRVFPLFTIFCAYFDILSCYLLCLIPKNARSPNAMNYMNQHRKNKLYIYLYNTQENHWHVYFDIDNCGCGGRFFFFLSALGCFGYLHIYFLSFFFFYFSANP